MCYPPQLILVRHGATRWSESGNYTGWTDLPLIEKGKEQALAARDNILDGNPNMVVYSSDLQRAVLTAELATRREPVKEKALREFDYGDFEGVDSRVARQAMEQFAGVSDWNPLQYGTRDLPILGPHYQGAKDNVYGDTGDPNIHIRSGEGETLIAAYRRLNPLLIHWKSLLREGKSVVVVAHGHILTVLLTYALHINIMKMTYAQIKNFYFMSPAGITKLNFISRLNELDCDFRNNFNIQPQLSD